MTNFSSPRSRFKTTAAYLVFAVTLPGCGGCPPVKIKTIELQPVDIKTGRSGFAGSQGWCLSGGNPPPSPFSAGPGQVLIGFDDYFKPGTDPFPCDDIRAVVFRGGVLFDVSQFDAVAIAELLFDTDSSVQRSHGETTGQTPPISYATTLGVGTQPWLPPPAMPDDDEVSLPSGPSLSLAVGSQVGNWVTKSRPNFGFIISGPRGPVDPHNVPKDNDAQLSWYSNFRLRITYNPDLNPRAPQ